MAGLKSPVYLLPSHECYGCQIAFPFKFPKNKRSQTINGMYDFPVFFDALYQLYPIRNESFIKSAAWVTISVEEFPLNFIFSPFFFEFSPLGLGTEHQNR